MDDATTALLMQRFRENLAGRHGTPMAKGRALQEAKAWLRDYRDDGGDRPFAHPTYWSGFVLIGDARGAAPVCPA